MLRQNPHNVHEWHKRVKLFDGKPARQIEEYARAVNVVDPEKVVGYLVSQGTPNAPPLVQISCIFPIRRPTTVLLWPRSRSCMQQCFCRPFLRTHFHGFKRCQHTTSASLGHQNLGV